MSGSTTKILAVMGDFDYPDTPESISQNDNKNNQTNNHLHERDAPQSRPSLNMIEVLGACLNLDKKIDKTPR